MRKKLLLSILILCLATLLNWLGYWQTTWLAGFSIALVLTGRRRWLSSAAVGIIAWTLPLSIGRSPEYIWQIAKLIGGIMGLGGAGFVVLIVPALLGLMLAMLGTWAAAALQSVLGASTAARNSQPLTTDAVGS